MRSLKLLLMIFLCVLGAVSLSFAQETDVVSEDLTFKQDATTIFRLANEAYEERDFDRAHLLYSELANMEETAGEVYFNLGHLYALQGEEVLAYSAYLKAKKTMPRDQELERAIESVLASEFLSETSPYTHDIAYFLHKKMAKIQLKEWLGLSLLSLFLTFFLQTLIRIKPAFHALSRKVTLLLLSSLLLFTLTGLKYYDEVWRPSALVLTEKAVVRVGPFSGDKPLYELEMGQMVKVWDRHLEWAQIKPPGKETGWITTLDIDII